MAPAVEPSDAVTVMSGFTVVPLPDGAVFVPLAELAALAVACALPRTLCTRAGTDTSIVPFCASIESVCPAASVAATPLSTTTVTDLPCASLTVTVPVFASTDSTVALTGSAATQLDARIV
jgi:hypothetical protein